MHVSLALIKVYWQNQSRTSSFIVQDTVASSILDRMRDGNLMSFTYFSCDDFNFVTPRFTEGPLKYEVRRRAISVVSVRDIDIEPLPRHVANTDDETIFRIT